jgi:hypothetical protein
MPLDSFNLGTSGLSADIARKMYFMLHSGQDNVVPKAGGGQSGATPITAIITRVTTVATNGDSVIMPPAVQGKFFIKNDGGHQLAIFPQLGEKMNSTKNASFSLNAAQAMLLFCVTNGEWHTLASA